MRWGVLLVRMCVLTLAMVGMLAVPQAHAAKAKGNASRQTNSSVIDGAVGGTLTSGKWKLEIPAGAFTGKATVTILETATSDGMPTVDLSISDPTLNNFRVPVWLSHKEKGNETKNIYWWDPSAMVWRPVPGQLLSLLDALGIEIKVPLFHFSSYSVRGGKAGW